jgi:hypothetical protein
MEDGWGDRLGAGLRAFYDFGKKSMNLQKCHRVSQSVTDEYRHTPSEV